MNELISVVIPVFNVEKYIGRCVESVIHQTYKNIEVFLVDDGSTDSSGMICDYYEKKDERVKAIHKSNGGLSDARNCGIEKSQGQYITFVDSDDFVSENYLEVLHSMILEDESDIAVCRMEKVFDSTKRVFNGLSDCKKLYSQDEYIFQLLVNNITTSSCAILYKKCIFERIKFPLNTLYEDLATTFRVSLEIQKASLTEEKMYKYYIRSGSIMNSAFSEKQLVELEIIDEEMDRIKNAKPELCLFAEGRLVYSYFAVLKRILSSSNKEDYAEEISKIKTTIFGYRKSLLLNRSIKKGLKLRLLAISFGNIPYLLLEKIIEKYMMRQK